MAGVRVSRKNSYEESRKKYEGKNLANDDELYSYEFLTGLPDIAVSIEGNLKEATREDGSIDHALLKSKAMENAEKYGKKVDGEKSVIIQNDYTGRNVRVTGRGADHGTNNRGNDVANKINARAGMIIGELVKKAVPLNAEYDKAKNVHGTYLMAAPMRSENEKIISTAVLTIEVRSGNLQGITVYDQTHSVSVRKKNVAGLDASASPVRSDQNDRSAVTRSTYSIADFLELVHSTHQSLLSENVLKHFGEERNKNGHYNGRMKFSRKGLDPIIDEELEHTRDAFEQVRHTHRITAAEANQLAGKVLKEANSSCAVYRRRLMSRVKLNNESKLGLKKVLNSIQNA